MTTFYLIRHCEAEGNKLRRCHGSFDCDITIKGENQIELLRKRFENIKLDAVYSSDIYRAYRTALPLAKDRGLAVTTLAGLREMHMGDWEDKSWGEIARIEPEGKKIFTEHAHLLDKRVTGGESAWGVSNRIMQTLGYIGDKHQNQSVAAVFHGTALRAFLCRALRMPWDQLKNLRWCDNTGVNMIEYENGQFNVVYYNDNQHLNPQQSTMAGEKWTKNSMDWLDIYLWYRMAGTGDFAMIDDAYTTEGFTKMDEGDCAYIGVLSGKSAGFFILDTVTPDDSAELKVLYVLPQYRGKNVSGQMLGEGCSMARRAGKKRMRIKTTADNGAAIRFLKSNKFVLAEDRGNRLTFEMPLRIESLL